METIFFWQRYSLISHLYYSSLKYWLCCSNRSHQITNMLNGLKKKMCYCWKLQVTYCNLLLSVFVRRPPCINNLYIWLLLWNHCSDFDETWSQCHLVVGIRICTWKGSDPPGGWGAGPNSAKSFDFSSETTGQILMKLGNNDHLVVGIKIYTWKWSDPPGGWGAGQMGVI